jgi:hypothetical protein
VLLQVSLSFRPTCACARGGFGASPTFIAPIAALIQEWVIWADSAHLRHMRLLRAAKRSTHYQAADAPVARLAISLTELEP